MSDIERAKFGRVAVATRAMAVWSLPGRLAARDAQEVRSSMSLAVQSRSEVGWIASEAVWLICPRLTDRLVGR